MVSPNKPLKLRCESGRVEIVKESAVLARLIMLTATFIRATETVALPV